MEDIVERVLNFNQSLTDEQRSEFVERLKLEDDQRTRLDGIIKELYERIGIMNGRFNIDMEYVKKALFKEDQSDRLILTEMEEENFKRASEILAHNKKNCEQFRNPNPDGGGIISPMSEEEISKWGSGIFGRLQDLTIEKPVSQ